jgi:hypothetical protein
VPLVILEVATGNDAGKAVVAALIHHGLLGKGELTLAAVGHDDGCPCTTVGAPMRRCTCELVELVIVKVGEL